MENTKRRKIYDNDAVKVDEVTVNKKKNLKIDLDDKPVAKSSSVKKTLLVKDVLSAFAGYLPPRANFMDSGNGECKICGKETSSAMRTICFDCMCEHGKKIYDVAKDAIEKHMDSFEF